MNIGVGVYKQYNCIDDLECKQSKPIQINTNKVEYKMKLNNFNPIKDSPNYFLMKLKRRMNKYHLEEGISNTNTPRSLTAESE